eukprot:scaffold172620_cov17-Tisochrysis_lutea.AAC.1
MTGPAKKAVVLWPGRCFCAEPQQSRASKLNWKAVSCAACSSGQPAWPGVEFHFEARTRTPMLTMFGTRLACREPDLYTPTYADHVGDLAGKGLNGIHEVVPAM